MCILMHRNNELMVKKMDTNFGNWDFDKSNDIHLLNVEKEQS